MPSEGSRAPCSRCWAASVEQDRAGAYAHVPGSVVAHRCRRRARRAGVRHVLALRVGRLHPQRHARHRGRPCSPLWAAGTAAVVALAAGSWWLRKQGLLFARAPHSSVAPAPTARAPTTLAVEQVAFESGSKPGWLVEGVGHREVTDGAPARVDFASFGAFILRHAELSERFGAVSFRVKAPPSFKDFLRVSLRAEGADETKLPGVRVTQHDTAPLPDGWAEVLLPLSTRAGHGRGTRALRASWADRCILLGRARRWDAYILGVPRLSQLRRSGREVPRFFTEDTDRPCHHPVSVCVAQPGLVAYRRYHVEPRCADIRGAHARYLVLRRGRADPRVRLRCIDRRHHQSPRA